MHLASIRQRLGAIIITVRLWHQWASFPALLLVGDLVWVPTDGSVTCWGYDKFWQASPQDVELLSVTAGRPMCVVCGRIRRCLVGGQ